MLPQYPLVKGRKGWAPCPLKIYPGQKQKYMDEKNNWCGKNMWILNEYIYTLVFAGNKNDDETQIHFPTLWFITLIKDSKYKREWEKMGERIVTKLRIRLKCKKYFLHQSKWRFNSIRPTLSPTPIHK